ncbi:MAG: hypothetical protein SVY53_14930 [Chloroflexota bacterium]|nr:hypothetical protein [Chloroflexota bacterium]
MKQETINLIRFQNEFATKETLSELKDESLSLVSEVLCSNRHSL